MKTVVIKVVTEGFTLRSRVCLVSLDLKKTLDGFFLRTLDPITRFYEFLRLSTQNK